VVDDINRTQVGNSSAAKDTATVTQPIWLTETDLVYVTGTNKVKLSLQSRLLQAIFKDAFENVRRDLLFEHAFPDAVAIPAVVRKALVSAAEANTFCDGRYNASAAAVHQRLLSHDDYQAKMIRLVSSIISVYDMTNNNFSHVHASPSSEGRLRSVVPTWYMSIFSPSNHNLKLCEPSTNNYLIICTRSQQSQQ
jgi:hypothetical protein